MVHISQLAPGKAERVITFGGTRAGKSSLTDMTMMQVQHDRPAAMQILIDTKPRYRAEKERGRTYNGRKNAAYRYEAWEAGPTIPNSCIVDIWDPHPFKGMWIEPGEIAIMQGGDFDDWRRMLQLLKGFVAAPIKGRERRIIVDECLDFTSVTRSELIHVMTCFTGLLGQAENAELVSILERIGYTVCPRSFCNPRAESTYFTCGQTGIWRTCGKSESGMRNPRKVITCSGSIVSSREERCRNHSQANSNCQHGTYHSYRTRREGLDVKLSDFDQPLVFAFAITFTVVGMMSLLSWIFASTGLSGPLGLVKGGVSA
jgi:hypothetical protein